MRISDWSSDVCSSDLPPGCCSFATSKPELPSAWRCRAAAFIGAEAFREARRLHGLPMRKRRIPGLSPRKLEVIRLAAIGNSDREIAMSLNLKRSTVETYMAHIPTAFEVTTRTHHQTTRQRIRK